MIASAPVPLLRVGIAGLGMIFDETYRPFFANVAVVPLFHPSFGIVPVRLDSVATRTTTRADAYRRIAP
ncbi:MAG: hypothetical protein ACRCZF_01380, partial [Gemmataceae bacterium]